MTTTTDLPDLAVRENSGAKIRFQVLDASEDPIDSTAFTVFTLDLYDLSADSAINSRSAQNVLNANNVTVEAAATVNAATAANPVVITTAAAHKLKSGDRVALASLGGMTELNDRTFDIHVVDSTSFKLVGEDGTNHTAYTSGGSATTGVVEWDVQPGDNPIVGTVAAGSYEVHIALFQWETTAGDGNAEQRIKVRSINKIT